MPEPRPPLALAVVAFLMAVMAPVLACAAPGFPGFPGFIVAQDETPSTPAEREWQRITDEVIPKLVAFKALPPEEQKKETFAAELARIAEFVRGHAVKEPAVAARARVFMATKVLADALKRDREAVEVLRDVAAKCTAEEEMLAGTAALGAGDLLFKLGDDPGLRELRELYAGRPSHDALFLQRLDQLCKLVRLQPGRPFPELALAGLDGKPIPATALRGRLLVVLLFNLDHSVSHDAFVQLGSLLDERADPGLGALGISVDKDKAAVAKELARFKTPFPIDCSGLEWEGPAVQELGISKLPALFLLDPKGVILFARLGSWDPAQLPKLLDEQLVRLRAEG